MKSFLYFCLLTIDDLQGQTFGVASQCKFYDNYKVFRATPQTNIQRQAILQLENGRTLINIIFMKGEW